MSDYESKELRTMRMMCWERAIGEMKAALQTYWGNKEGWEESEKFVNKTIKEAEDHGIFD